MITNAYLPKQAHSEQTTVQTKVQTDLPFLRHHQNMGCFQSSPQSITSTSVHCVYLKEAPCLIP